MEEAEVIIRKYSGSDSYMVTTARVIYTIFNANLSDFTSFDGTLDTAFAAAFLAAVIAAEGLISAPSMMYSAGSKMISALSKVHSAGSMIRSAVPLIRSAGSTVLSASSTMASAGSMVLSAAGMRHRDGGTP